MGWLASQVPGVGDGGITWGDGQDTVAYYDLYIQNLDHIEVTYVGGMAVIFLTGTQVTVMS